MRSELMNGTTYIFKVKKTPSVRKITTQLNKTHYLPANIWNIIKEYANIKIPVIQLKNEIIFDNKNNNSINIQMLCEQSCKKRKSTDYNGMELLVAILITNPNINNLTILIDNINNKNIYSNIVFNSNDDLYKYTEDLLNKTHLIPNYIDNFKISLLNENINNAVYIYDNIKKVFVSGKHNKHQEIYKLNIGINNKIQKSDLYIQLISGNFIGFSIKQSETATKCNYSVQKFFDKATDNNLTTIKKTYLLNNGILRFDKTQRNTINELFYPIHTNNPYWRELKTQIMINKSKIIKQIIDYLTCCNIHYNIYEFNGVSLVKLNSEYNLSNITFEEHIPYYYNSHMVIRKCAKLFYKLSIHEKKIYKVEIRWKGNIYNASPQFQIHEEI